MNVTVEGFTKHCSMESRTSYFWNGSKKEDGGSGCGIFWSNPSADGDGESDERDDAAFATSVVEVGSGTTAL